MIISDLMFKQKIKNNSDTWVVGLSGGADSLCLTMLSDIYAKQNNIKLYACIVDHKLRLESSEETFLIINILKERNIEYKVTIWEHAENIGGNIEKKARDARYKLLYDFCKEVKSEVLMTAHHSLDQWETFFMRLSRGSSVRGLSCIKSISKLKDIFLLRPMLDFTPNDIKETLKKRFKIREYVNDPMNKDIKYDRVFWRNSYKKLSKCYKLNIDNVNKSISRIQRANDCLDEISLQYASEIFEDQHINIEKFKSLHIELKIRVLDILVKIITQKNQIISNSLLENIAKEILKKDFKACNFGGVVLRKARSENIKIYQEIR